MQRVRDELREVRQRQGAQRDLAERCTGGAQLAECERQRVPFIDLVVAVGADHEQPSKIRIGEQGVQQREGRRIGPLQVVEEDHQRVGRRGEHAEEPLEQEVEPVLGLRGSQDRHRGLLPDDELHGRDDVDDDLAIDSQGAEQRIVPPANSLLAFRQQLPHEAPERLCQAPIGSVANQLVELPRDEVPSAGGERLVQLVDERRLSNP